MQARIQGAEDPLHPGVTADPMLQQAGQAYSAAGGNPWERAAAVTAATERNYPIQTLITTNVTDPMNLLGPIGKVGKLGKVAEVASAIDKAQALPLEGILSFIARNRAAREAADEAGKVAAREAIDLPLAPNTGNLRAYLKEIGLPSPKAVKPEPSALAPKDFSIIRAAKQAKPETPPVTPAEELAAKVRDLGEVAPPEVAPAEIAAPTASRREMLAGLSRSDLARLVSTAYNDVPKAIGNARAKYTDPADLAERALERIGQSDRLSARLQQRAPDLAEWVASLPEAVADDVAEVVQGATPPPINAVGKSIDEIVAQAQPVSAIAEEVAPAQSLAEAIAAHRALPADKRAAALGDIYKEMGAPKEVKGIGRTGEEIIGYAYSPDLFIKSEATGAPIRHYVTLPNGMRVHPDELRRATITPSGEVRFAPPVAAQVKVGKNRARGIANLGDLLTETILPGVNNPRRAAAEQIPVRLTLDDGSVVETTQGAIQAAGKGIGASLPLSTFVTDYLDAPVKAASGMIDTAAGGGMGIAPAAIERTLTGAAAGGLGGVVAGALAPADSTEDRAKNIAIGASAGLVGGGNVGAAAPQLRRFAQQAARQVAANPQQWGKLAEGRLLADPEILADVLTAVRRAQDDAAGKAGPRGLDQVWRAFAAQWKRQAVDTFKQLPQDATYRATVIEGIARSEFGIGEQDARAFQRAVSRERATGAWSLDDPYNQLLIEIGHPELIGLKRDVIGTDFIDAVTDVADKDTSRFGRGGSAIAGALIGMGSGLKRVNPVSPVFGAIRGAADLEVSTALHHLISTANDAWREAMAHAGTVQRLATVGDDFLADLAKQGVDITPLANRAGRFTGDEVAAIAGKQAGDDWHALSEATARNVGDRVAFLAGDFRDKLNPKYTGTVTQTDRLLGGVEKAAGKFAPFARWQIRSTPVLLEVAARHPLATYHVVSEMQRLGEEAKAEGKRAYQAGYDISTETPLLGAVARARLGGKQGTWTIDPYGAVVPYGEALAGGDGENPDDQTAYQRVAEILGRVGFGPNPLIQAAAYTTGQDYRAPSSLSRTSGLEQLGTLIPGVGDIELPTGRTLLDAARKGIEPALADAGIKTTGPASASDPVLRRYAELVFDKTGKPVADRANGGYLRGDTPEAQALMDQARREEALQAAAGNAVSLTSPIPSTAQSADSAAAQAARKPVIEAQKMVDTLPPVQGALLQQQIDQYKQANPQTRIYDGANPRARAELLLADWERQHALLAFFPAMYEYQRQIAAEELGLVEKGTLAKKQRALDESGQQTAVPGVANTLRVDPSLAGRLRQLNAVR